MNDSLQEQYAFDFETTFSNLERVGDYEFESGSSPSYADDPYGNIYEDAVYGGDVDPGKSQQFYVYRVDWPEDGELPSRDEIEELGDRLDNVFEGWIINDDGERVFALGERR